MSDAEADPSEGESVTIFIAQARRTRRQRLASWLVEHSKLYARWRWRHWQQTGYLTEDAE